MMSLMSWKKRLRVSLLTPNSLRANRVDTWHFIFCHLPLSKSKIQSFSAENKERACFNLLHPLTQVFSVSLPFNASISYPFLQIFRPHLIGFPVIILSMCSYFGCILISPAFFHYICLNFTTLHPSSMAVTLVEVIKVDSRRMMRHTDASDKHKHLITKPMA